MTIADSPRQTRKWTKPNLVRVHRQEATQATTSKTKTGHRSAITLELTTSSKPCPTRTYAPQKANVHNNSSDIRRRRLSKSSRTARRVPSIHSQTIRHVVCFGGFYRFLSVWKLPCFAGGYATDPAPRTRENRLPFTLVRRDNGAHIASSAKCFFSCGEAGDGGVPQAVNNVGPPISSDIVRSLLWRVA